MFLTIKANSDEWTEYYWFSRYGEESSTENEERKKEKFKINVDQV